MREELKEMVAEYFGIEEPTAYDFESGCYLGNSDSDNNFLSLNAIVDFVIDNEWELFNLLEDNDD